MQKTEASEQLIVPDMLDKAYAAGFFDGEGSVVFNSNNIFQVSIAQNVQEPLEWFIPRWGGSLYYGCGATGNSINYRLSKLNDVRRLLEDMQTFLKVKRATAEVVLAAIDLSPAQRKVLWTSFKKGNHHED